MLRDLRRSAVAWSLFQPTSLGNAVQRLGFVQADPIRAPARAQDLTLFQRVAGYRAGDLERQYTELDVEEDTFINYGYVTRSVHELMHPRTARSHPPAPRSKREHALLAFLRRHGRAHPRDVDRHFAHGNVTNYWGGSSRATTYLLEEMHYRGLVRVVARERGVRIYAAREQTARPDGPLVRHTQIDKLVDILVRTYAPLPLASLAMVIGRLRYGVPQWHGDLKDALKRARDRLAHSRAGTDTWYWPADAQLSRDTPDQPVRLLTPFDPLVWDRRRFELLWGWQYRFEAYTPARRRKFGYYALPMLWRDQLIGWGNLTAVNGDLQAEFGYVRSRPRDRAFHRELADEIDRIRAFLKNGFKLPAMTTVERRPDVLR